MPRKSRFLSWIDTAKAERGAMDALKKAGLNKGQARVALDAIGAILGSVGGGSEADQLAPGDEFFVIFPVAVPARLDRAGRIVLKLSDLDVDDDVEQLIEQWEEGEADLFLMVEGEEEEIKLDCDEFGAIKIE